jgi:hypothetical protein
VRGAAIAIVAGVGAFIVLTLLSWAAQAQTKGSILPIVHLCVSASGAAYREMCQTVDFPDRFERFEECLLFIDDFVRDSRGKAHVTDAGCHRRMGFEL